MDQEQVKNGTAFAAIITVSTTRTAEQDLSGPAIRTILDDAGIETVYYAVVPDDIGRIRTAFFAALSLANCIIINGGTGLTHDDRTIEAIEPLLEKRMDGFGELFRWKSYGEIGTAAMLSRALGGTFGGRAIFCIPGSPKAVQLAVRELIIPEITHILSHASR
jgi:molybdenum cofactor biosynthesis protein B